MGRELKRVPLDFAWPLNKVWGGYINPYDAPCPADGVDCFAGYTAAGKWLDSLVHLIAMLGNEAAMAPRAELLRASGRLYPHPYLSEWPQAPRHELPRDVSEHIRAASDQAERTRRWNRALAANPPRVLPLTEELASLVGALAGGEELGSLFGSSRIEWNIQKAILKAAGCDADKWGTCKVCDGSGMDPAIKEAHDAWEEEEPPTGPGFQLWETTSEGSPVSPVFESLDALCQWCATGATTFGDARATAEEWRRMLDDGCVVHREGNAVFL